MTLSRRRNVAAFKAFKKFQTDFLEFLTVMILTFVLSQFFIVKLLTKPILLRINNIVFTNEKLFRFKMIDFPLCAFSQTEVESPEHLFFHCDTTKSFWQLLCSWNSEPKVISIELTLENVIFGVFNVVEDFHILNHIILLAKYFIYN